MINHFPTPLPDELFYSLCARYGERVRYSDIEAVNEDLFGARGKSAVVDLPSHLGHFVRSLPPNHDLTLSRLIYKHTLLPFYAPFLPAERLGRDHVGAVAAVIADLPQGQRAETAGRNRGAAAVRRLPAQRLNRAASRSDREGQDHRAQSRRRPRAADVARERRAGRPFPPSISC